MSARRDAAELIWPLAPGGVLVLVGGFVAYALRGPSLELPSSPGAAVALLVAAFTLGHLARLAASAAAWGAHAVWAADLFLESSAGDLVDDLSPRKLLPALTARIDAGLRARFGLGLETIARGDSEEAREQKARRAEEAVALARSRVASDPVTRATIVWLEARADAARALCAALGIASLGTLFVAGHDFLFARSVAHAFSGLSLVVLGLGLLVASVAALGRARSAVMRIKVETLLTVVQESGAA